MSPQVQLCHEQADTLSLRCRVVPSRTVLEFAIPPFLKKVLGNFLYVLERLPSLTVPRISSSERATTNILLE